MFKKTLLLIGYLFIFVLLEINVFAQDTMEDDQKKSVTKNALQSVVSEPRHIVFNKDQMVQVRPSSEPKEKLWDDVEEPDRKLNSKGWETIKSEGFEGDFPNDWQLFVNSGAANAYWDDVSYRSSSGYWSGYCADGGDQGVPPPGPYPNDMSAWMIYGPFDLSDATDAKLYFYLWIQTESNYDYFVCHASIDGIDFYGNGWSGSSGGWITKEFDLTDVYTLGNLCGNSQVWIAFYFYSDYSNNYEGAYIDQIELVKNVFNQSPDDPDFYSSGPSYLYPTKSYSITVDYTDPDGASDLEDVYLRLAQGAESTYPITIMWDLANSPGQWAGEILAVENLSATKSGITNGYRVTWNFEMKWNWYESSNIDYWAFATDQSSNQSNHTKVDKNAYYENDIRIYTSNENQDPVTAGDTYTISGDVCFEGSTTAPSDWSGISVEMRQASAAGALLDTDASVSSGYSVDWDTDDGDVGSHNIYIVPLNTNHQPPNNSDTYWDMETITVNPDLVSTRFQSDFFVNKVAKYGIPILLEAKLQKYQTLIWWAIEGETIHFDIYYDSEWHEIPDDGISSTSFITDSDGIARVYYTAPTTLSEGNKQIRARYEGSGQYASCDIEATLNINKPQWLFMVYLCADNDLEEAGINDYFNEMWSARDNNEVSIVVLFDRISGYSSYEPDWTTAYYLRICQNANIYTDWGEVNMGNENTLDNFIEQSTGECKAENIALVFWNHGTGWVRTLNNVDTKGEITLIEQKRGIPELSPMRSVNTSEKYIKSVCYDETSGNDRLTMREIRTILEKYNKLEIIGFDACLMGMVEVVYDIKDNSDYTVVSENTESGDGWEYQNILTTANLTSITTPLQLGQKIVDGSSQSTLGCWEISSTNVNTLSAEISNFADRLINLLPSIRVHINTAWNNSRKFRPYSNWPEKYIDLREFSLEIISVSSDEELQSRATAVANRLINSTFRRAWETTLSNPENLGGLSIYFPPDKYGTEWSDYDDLDVLEFTTDPDQHWDDFLRAYFDQDNPLCAITEPNSGGWDKGDISVSANASDPSTEVDHVEFQYSIDHTNWYPLPSPDSDSGIDYYGDNGWTLNFRTTDTPQHGNINDESVWVRARAFDLAGNESEWDECDVSFGIDNTAPNFSTWANTADPLPGDYSMMQSITDNLSGVRDDINYPRFYYRWNNNIVDIDNFDGAQCGNYKSDSYYESVISVSEDHEGDNVYWRVRALDNIENENWSAVHDGGMIGDDDTEGPQFDQFADSGDNPPGPYSFIVRIRDEKSGVLDNDDYPRIYYRYDNNTIDDSHYDGYTDADYTDVDTYSAEIDIGDEHNGQIIYWRAYAIDSDNSPTSAWSTVQVGGLISTTPIISGNIHKPDNTPVEDVHLSGFPDEVYTDANGDYSASVEYGWSGTVTPEKTGRTFDPPNSDYSNVTSDKTQDYVASVQMFTISGNIHELDNTPIENVSISGLPEEVYTDANGDYSASVEYGWSGTVTPEKTGWTFDPPSSDYANVTSDKTQDYVGTRDSYSISGNIHYCDSGISIEGAAVNITGDTEFNTNTDGNGNYQLDDIQGNVTLTASKSDEIGDINGFDLLRLKNILLEVHTPTALESWAGDCNGDAAVNGFDLLRLKNYLLEIPVDPPIATWGFDPGNYSYSPIDTDKADQDFAGVIFGDVNLSWGSSSSVLAKSTGDGRIDFGSYSFDNVGNIHVPIVSDRELHLGMLDWSIEFDSTLFTLESINSRFLEQGDYHCSKGQVKIVWVYSGEEEVIRTDESICELILKPLREQGIGKLGFIGENYLANGNEEPYDLTYGDTQLNLTFLAISENGVLPTETTLYPNYPNPFNPRTTISFYLKENGDVTVHIFNLRGESQRSYHYPKQAAGFYQLEWNGKDSQGMAVPSGIYFYQLQHEGFSQMKRMVLMK